MEIRKLCAGIDNPLHTVKTIHWKGMTPVKLQNRLVYILAVLMTTPLLGTIAPPATLHVLRVFDMTGHPVATQPQKVSDQSDIVGTVTYVNGKAQGFIYKIRANKFSSAFSEPNDTGNFTQGRGINNRRHCVGEYLNGSDGTFHGYLVKHPDFFEFDVAGATDTIPLGINNDGSIVGTVLLSNGTQPAFLSMLQTVTTFAVPGATATFAYQLNASNQIIGYYTDANGITHGYTRDSAGTLTFPIDVPGSTGTMLLGNNDMNWGVGRYTDASGVTHGLYFITPDEILTFDYPGATSTSLNGINRLGIVCGYYVDEAGITHGLVAQVESNATPTPTPTPTATPTPTSTPTATPTSSPTPTSTPAPTDHPAPEMLKIVEPAL